MRDPMPDVLALPLEEARELLEDAGFQVQERWTKPVGRAEPVGTARVVRQRQLSLEVVEIVAAHHTARAGSPEAGRQSGGV